MGRDAQYAGHGDLRGRGHRRIQAICGVRRLYQPDERLLRGLPLRREGEVRRGACPFNRLYWGFLERNRDRLRGNIRLAMPYRTLEGFGEAKRAELLAEAEAARLALGAVPIEGPGAQ